MTDRHFRLEIADRVARLTLDQPARMNAMSPSFWRELDAILDTLQREAPARALVLDASGKHFCAGMALEAFGSAIAPDESSAASRANIAPLLAGMQRTFDRLAELRMPVLAAIQGACIGGGLDLVCTADMRYCTRDAFFCVQEINIGMAADLGTLQRLPRLIPEGMARELAYTGRRLPAERALSLGLVNEVFDDTDAMLAGVMQIAREIGSKPPVAIWATKQAIDYARDHSVADGLRQMGWLQSGLWDTAAVAEAIRARAEKREPVFADLAPLRHFTDA
ncbi:MAG: enoyl-CoA hydratase [Lautropia sp.]|nr:MAG: enoyl-CoA hydratase [Pseudomonadota bacterium]MBC6960525.1 enoyl-CoA hydratase [Lautropia sp.]MCL4701139.1 enoyl-CoA hydratase/isomerase family protein [Burkholderiaceae bacterium]MDL1908855.1 enoyl-CoA hydratase [Betaproteobacteria bacterium PRO1]RIK88527.1 MAG: enoyl-CoA hydratase [Burkholderiales bacterium]